MSKKALRKYLEELPKKGLEDQVLELYDRLKEVRDFYNFVFNPREDKVLDEAKFKISKEYFPQGKRRAKKRRSTAQNLIKEFIKLGVAPEKTADLMLFNIEVAQTYTQDVLIKQEAFYKSMLKSFKEAVRYVDKHGLQTSHDHRITRVVEVAIEQKWINAYAFDDIVLSRVQ
ncbi:MAG: DUF6155 family protein [Crocinitomicaceae bacterium]